MCPFPIVKLRVCGKFGCCLKKDAEGAGHELLLLLRKWTKHYPFCQHQLLEWRERDFRNTVSSLLFYE